jgi:hypothetical protein
MAAIEHNAMSVLKKSRDDIVCGLLHQVFAMFKLVRALIARNRVQHAYAISSHGRLSLAAPL